jgi:hypothetical protein
MPKLSRKAMSIEHEEYIAKMLDGKRERASGASITAPGDVITPTHLIECKVSESGTVSLSAKQWRKISEEAATRGRRPMGALRLRDPYNKDRHVDVLVKLLDDEVEDQWQLTLASLSSPSA